MDDSHTFKTSREALLREILCEVLGGLDDTTWEQLIRGIYWKDLGAGEILCREGDEADAMYVVVSGRLRATRKEDGETRTIGEIRRGETVGEMALLTGGTRSATVEALRDCVLAGLDHPTFHELARVCPEIVLHVARIQFERLQQANRAHPTENPQLSVAVLSADPTCDATIFAKKFHTEISRRSKSILADQQGSPSGGTTDADRRHRLAIWLNELESSAPILVMACDATDSLWTRQCLHSADVVLILVRSGHLPSLPQTLFPSTLRRALLVLHPDDTQRPQGTNEAMTACEATFYFHLREDSQADLSRLGRILTGRGNGISFAGGGARSFCHLGVLRALAEHGIPLDMASGTSLGAIIAACVSLDFDLDTMMERFRVMVDVNPTRRDYLFIPRRSLLSGRKLDRLLPQLLPDVDITDCWKNFACVSANITNPKSHIHRSGSFLHALRASVSIPGVFPPTYSDNGDLLVDGGVINNLPADILHEMGAARIIACDQSGGNKGDAEQPNIIGIIMRSVILHSTISGNIWRTSADLYFDSPVGDIGLLDWGRFDLAVQRGYENAKRALENVDPAPWQ